MSSKSKTLGNIILIYLINKYVLVAYYMLELQWRIKQDLDVKGIWSSGV